MFKVSIRELLLVTAIAAVALGWWIDRSRLSARADEADTWKFRAESLGRSVRDSGWEVTWDDTYLTVVETRADGTKRARKSSLPLPNATTPPLLAVPVRQAQGIATASPESANPSKD